MLKYRSPLSSEYNRSFSHLQEEAFDQENKVSKMFDVDAMPSTVFIDRAGNVRFLHRGYKSGDEKHHKKLMKALMRE